MWIVTFTDMISLLLTFFIMILTFSSMEDQKLQAATGSLAGAFGVMTPDRRRSRPDIVAEATSEDIARDRDGTIDPSKRPDRVKEAVKKIQDREIFDVKIDTEDMVEGTRIRVLPERGTELFYLGTDRLTDHARQVLEEIAVMFHGRPCRLIVETHVDDLIWRTRRGQTASDLSLAMAISVADVLESKGIPGELVGVSPKGSLMPVAPNDDALSRARNRRVEILVVPHTKDELFANRLGGS